MLSRATSARVVLSSRPAGVRSGLGARYRTLLVAPGARTSSLGDTSVRRRLFRTRLGFLPLTAPPGAVFSCSLLLSVIRGSLFLPPAHVSLLLRNNAIALSLFLPFNAHTDRFTLSTSLSLFLSFPPRTFLFPFPSRSHYARNSRYYYYTCLLCPAVSLPLTPSVGRSHSRLSLSDAHLSFSSLVRSSFSHSLMIFPLFFSYFRPRLIAPLSRFAPPRASRHLVQPLRDMYHRPRLSPSILRRRRRPYPLTMLRTPSLSIPRRNAVTTSVLFSLSLLLHPLWSCARVTR